MLTKELHLPGTDRTPDTLFKADGTFRIKGRSFRTFLDQFPDELYEWLEQYIKNPAEVTTVKLAFEYLNSVSTSSLIVILSILLKVEPSGKLVICWYYEHDDEDMFERGQYISQALNFPFRFIETDNIHWI